MRTLNQTTQPQPGSLLRLRDVLRHFPVSRSSWYQGIKDGRYPAAVRLGIRSVAWRWEEVFRLIELAPAVH